MELAILRAYGLAGGNPLDTCTHGGGWGCGNHAGQAWGLSRAFRAVRF